MTSPPSPSAPASPPLEINKRWPYGASSSVHRFFAPWIWGLALKTERWGKVLHGEDKSAAPVWRALAVGAVGGAVASAFNLPLAWMMGAMIASGVAAAAGMSGRIPQNLRRIVLAIAGIYIGAGVTPDLLDRMGKLPVSLGMLTLYVSVATLAAALIFRHLMKTSRTTACCAAVPGGLSVAVAMAENRGDDRFIALMHMTRASLVVVAIPMLVKVTGGFDEALAEKGAGLWGWDYEAELTNWRGLSEVALVTGLVAGVGVLLKLKAPAFLLLAAGISATARILGWTEDRPPDFPLNGAMIVLGAAVGSGCHIMRGKGIFLILTVGVLVVMGMLGLSVLFATIGSSIMDMPFYLALLFFTPGGVAEISLIAVALGTDPPLVALHQTLRLMLILAVAPMVIALASRFDGQPEKK